MFLRDGRDNRLVNYDMLATDGIIPKDEYRQRFDSEFGIRPGQQDCTAMQICGGPDMHDSSTSNESDQPACGTHENANEQTPTNAYDAQKERTAWDNARAVQRNQKHMDQQTAADEVLFHEGDTVLISMPQRCRTKLDPANIIGCIRSVQVTSVERRYKITTPAGVLNRMHSGADLTIRTDCIALNGEDDQAMQDAVEGIACSMQHILPLAVHKHHIPMQSLLRGGQDAHQANGGVHRNVFSFWLLYATDKAKFCLLNAQYFDFTKEIRKNSRNI